MIVALTSAGVTILSTVEVEDTFTAFSFSHYAISFLTDDIHPLRYVEIDGQLRKVMVVSKCVVASQQRHPRICHYQQGRGLIHPRSTDYDG